MRQIAEYDAMVGTLMDAVQHAGVAENTYFIATSGNVMTHIAL